MAVGTPCYCMGIRWAGRGGGCLNSMLLHGQQVGGKGGWLLEFHGHSLGWCLSVIRRSNQIFNFQREIVFVVSAETFLFFLSAPHFTHLLERK